MSYTQTIPRAAAGLRHGQVKSVSVAPADKMVVKLPVELSIDAVASGLLVEGPRQGDISGTAELFPQVLHCVHRQPKALIYLWGNKREVGVSVRSSATFETLSRDLGRNTLRKPFAELCGTLFLTWFRKSSATTSDQRDYLREALASDPELRLVLTSTCDLLSGALESSRYPLPLRPRQPTRVSSRYQ